ncbi:hypothetical protein Q7P35_005272 [Cladosporium inversicolor]
MPTLNISLYLVPFAWLLAMLPGVYSLTAYAAHPKAQNSDSMKKNPRSIPAVVAADKTLPPQVRDPAVCAGNTARLDVPLLNLLAVVYIGSRLVYIPAYIYNDTVRSVYTRSAVFAVGLIVNVALFVLAGELKRSLNSLEHDGCENEPLQILNTVCGFTQAVNKVTLSISSNKRDDHSDQEVKSIPTRSMRLSSSKSSFPGSGKVVRLLVIVETVTAQGSALHPKRPSFPRMFQVFERELCIAYNYNNGLVRVRVPQTMTL